MKNFNSKLISLLLSFVLAFGFSVPTFAQSTTDSDSTTGTDSVADDGTASTTTEETDSAAGDAMEGDAMSTTDPESSSGEDDGVVEDGDVMEKEEDVMEEELDVEAVEDLAEDVSADTVVDVLIDDVSDAAGTDAAAAFLEEATDELLEDFDALSDTEVSEELEQVEGDVDDQIEALTEEARKNPRLRKKIQKKIRHLKALKHKLRAKTLKKHKKALKRIQKVVHRPELYKIRWGVLEGRPDCASVRADDLSDALAEDGILPGCEKVKVEYEGNLAVSSGKLHVQKHVLFEKNDRVTERSGDMIAWNSVIAGHWDGLVVQFKPEKDDGQEREPVEVTVKLGDLSKTFIAGEALGTHDIGDGHQLEITRFHRPIASVTGEKAEKLIENKLKVEDKLANLEEALHRLRLFNKHLRNADEIESLAEEVRNYTFDDESLADIEGELDLVVNDLDEEASDNLVGSKVDRLRDKLGKIKDSSRKRKFAQKLIPFKDTDDNEWYTGYVSNVEARGIISGYKDAAGNSLGEYRPGNNITVAELLKIGLETAEKGSVDGNPKLRAALNHWAKGYVKQAEDLGLDIVSRSDLSLNRPATRGEVVRLMLEALDVEPDSISKTDFSDVARAHKHAAFIQHAKELGIVSGDAGKTTFRPDAPVNRAEVAKIADLVIETILGE